MRLELSMLRCGICASWALALCGCGGAEPASGASASEVGSNLPQGPASAGAGNAAVGGVAGGNGTMGSGAGGGSASASGNQGEIDGFNLGTYMPAPALTPEQMMAMCQPNLTGLVRDFKGKNEPGGHPDFEAFSGGSASKGIVQPMLGADHKPVYASMGAFVDPQNGPQTTTQANFDQWYRDTPGVNMTTEFTIQLMPSNVPGVLTFDDPAFFPIDGMLFGNTPGQQHNFG
ncbi:MAG TPA: hypothetical protein VL137_15800, partial [Polyangiaceae bacterium]|nr:hypothetical protein [Polyangiaceae bacterium]